MNELINLIYVDGDPILTVVKLIIVIMFLELFSVVCAFLGGIR